MDNNKLETKSNYIKREQMKVYGIIGNVECDGLVFEKCFVSKEDAKEYFEILKNEYKDIGVFEEYEDLIIFNNDDEYKIVEIECNEID